MTDYNSIIYRLLKVAEDLKEAGHPSLAMRVSSLSSEVMMTATKKATVATYAGTCSYCGNPTNSTTCQRSHP